MHVWFELLSRELVLLLMLAVVGLGPVALLPASVDRASRLALAPALGLAIAACATTTALYRVPGYKGWPLLVVLMVASIGVAVWRARRAEPGAAEHRPLRVGRREAAQLVVLIGVVLVTLSAPLAQRDSTGPVGGYRIADATGYVSEIDGAQRESIHAAQAERPPYRDLTLQYWSGSARGFQQVGADAVLAYANAMLGLQAIDTNAPYLLVLILIVALGAFAVVRQVTGTRSWAAVVAGALVAGPFFRTLFMDGSQGAISGLAVVLPLLLAGWWALRFRRWWDLAAFGVLAAGLQTLYPLLVPPVVAGGGVVLVVIAVAAAARRRLSWPLAARGAAFIGAVLMLAAAITPVAFERNFRYWKSIFEGHFSFAGLPVYDLPPAVVPSWLVQTRELYDLPHLGHQSFVQLLVTVAIPVAIVALVAFGMVRHRVATGALAVVAVAVYLAHKTATDNDCSYCAQRNMLIVAPIMMALIGVGLASLRQARGALAVSAVPLGLLVVVAVGSMARHPAERLLYNSYIFDEQISHVLTRLPHDGQPVHLEGFGAGGLAPMELPLAYGRLDEMTSGQPSVAAETDDTHGFLYLGGPRPIGVEFRPDYRYVLTRLPSIVVPSRRTIDRDGPVALQRRTGDLDVTITSGVTTPFAWQDKRAPAYVVPSGILRFWVIGGPPHQTATLKLRFERDPRVTDLVVGGEASGPAPRDATVTVCVSAPGEPPVRRVDVPVTFTAPPARPPINRFAYPEIATGVRLVGMAASTQSCARR